MKDSSLRTYQTRPRISPRTEEALHACADLFARIEHSLLADISKGYLPHTLKSTYLTKYGITARQFNALRVKVEGKVASIKELRKIEISNLDEQIKALELKIARLQQKPTLSFLVHQKKRRLHKLQERQKQLIKEKRIPICFGSKKLFRA